MPRAARPLVGVLLTALTGAAHASPRTDHPWAVTAVLGLPGGVGVEAAWNPADRVALAAQVSSDVVFTDLGVRGRVYPVTFGNLGVEVGVGVHALVSPLVFTSAALAPEATLGLEWRAQSGFTLAGDLGPAVWIPGTRDKGQPYTLAAWAQARIGWAW